jgi:hypothetical protein
MFHVEHQKRRQYMKEILSKEEIKIIQSALTWFIRDRRIDEYGYSEDEIVAIFNRLTALSMRKS